MRTVQLKVVLIGEPVGFAIAESIHDPVSKALRLRAAMNEGLPPVSDDDRSMAFDLDGETLRVVAARLPNGAPIWMVTTFADAGATPHIVGFENFTRQVKQ